MSSFGQVPIKDVWDMLDTCAKGHTRGEYTHFYWIRYKTKTYPSLPKKSQVDRGHVKKMARHLEILDCAKTQLSLQ
jgi:hypothetical protein